MAIVKKHSREEALEYIISQLTDAWEVIKKQRPESGALILVESAIHNLSVMKEAGATYGVNKDDDHVD